MILPPNKDLSSLVSAVNQFVTALLSSMEVRLALFVKDPVLRAGESTCFEYNCFDAESSSIFLYLDSGDAVDPIVEAIEVNCSI
jgi:hypothetical protein